MEEADSSSEEKSEKSQVKSQVKSQTKSQKSPKGQKKSSEKVKATETDVYDFDIDSQEQSDKKLKMVKMTKKVDWNERPQFWFISIIYAFH